MSIFRSYFSKNNTLIKDNLTNNSQNPVHELFYGTENGNFSRYIFKIDLTSLAQKIASESIIQNKISKHELNITNTLVVRNDLIGTFMPDLTTQRASSFKVTLFSITEDWDEGNGYEFIYDSTFCLPVVTGASNYQVRKNNLNWRVAGAYVSSGHTGTTSQILGTQSFDKGNENVKFDITTYINKILYSGTTDRGLGLMYSSDLEASTIDQRYSFGLFGKKTNTYFEPFLQTEINDSYLDDRKYFYLDKDNDLYLVSKKGGVLDNVTVNSVTIVDQDDEFVTMFTGGTSGVTKVKTGIYKIRLSLDSAQYPDAVLFTDIWNVTDSSGKTKDVEQFFYLRNFDEYYGYNTPDRIEPDNTNFSYVGIKSGEIISRGDIRRIVVDYKQLYVVDDVPFNLEYRLFTKQGGNVDISIIDFTPINRIMDRYEFTLDTSWLIPSEYHLELKISYGGVFMVKNPISFRVQSEVQNFIIV